MTTVSRVVDGYIVQRVTVTGVIPLPKNIPDFLSLIGAAMSKCKPGNCGAILNWQTTPLADGAAG